MSSIEKKSIWLFRLSPSLLLGITLIFSLKVLGAEQIVVQAESSVPETQQIAPQPESSVPETQQVAPQSESSVPETRKITPQAEPSVPQFRQAERFDSMVAPRDYLSAKITDFATNIDRFFGGDRHYQESNQSVLQLNLTRATGYGGDGNFKFAARLNLKLPATEGRFRLLVETDSENNLTDEQTKSSAQPDNKVVAPSSVALAVRYEKKEESRWYFNADAGIKFRGVTTSPNPFVRARGSYSAPIGEWRLKVAESVYWFNTLGVGETTQLDLERILTTSLLFRSSSNATWLNDKQNFDLRQDLSIYHTLNDRTALLYQASVVGVSNPQYQVTDYVVLAFYRYRLNRKWLFFELSPQLHFPIEKNYKSSHALSVRLEILFDGSR